MATVLRASLNDILGAVSARIQSKTGLGPECVYPALKPTLVFQADKIVQLIPKEFSVEPVWSQGSGRRSTMIRRYLWVICSARLGLDDSPAATQLLTNSAGLIALEEQVVDALHEWLPVDSQNNSMLIEPIKLVGGIPENAVYQDVTEYGHAPLVFSLVYQAPVNQNDPVIIT